MTVQYLKRAQHYWDEKRDHHVDEERDRVIMNWANKQASPGAAFTPADKALVSEPRQIGPLTFQWHNDGVLEAHAGTADVPGNASPVAVSVPGKPNANCIIAALNPDNPATPMEKLASNTSVKLDEFWDDTTLYFGVLREKLAKLIKAKTFQAPSEYTFGVFPSKGTVEFGDNCAWVEHNGERYIDFPRPYGWDSSDGGNSGGMGEESKFIRMYLVDAGPITAYGRTGRKIKISVETDDVPGCTLPLWLDPTVEIVGAAAIEDTMMINAGSSSNNYGGNTTSAGPFCCGKRNTAGDVRRGLIWFVDPTNDLPAGTVTSFVLNGYIVTWSQTVNTGNAEFFILNSADTVVEGSSSAAAEIGATCWDWVIYNTQAWSGGVAGGGTFVADVSPPSAETGQGHEDSWIACTLKSSWAEDYKSGALLATQAMLSINAQEGTSGTACLCRTVERADHKPYFQITYTPLAGAGAHDRSHDRGHDRAHD